MPCQCVIKNREEGESQREWFKRWMCMGHWMQTDYYQHKLPMEKRTFANDDSTPEIRRAGNASNFTPNK